MAWPFKKKSAAPAPAAAPAQAPPEVGALQRLGGGAKSTLFSGLSKAKGKSGWALVIAILVAVGYFLYGMATGFVGFFSTVPFYFQILIIGIILTILVGAATKSGSAAVGIFFFFLIMTFAVWYLTATPYGQHIMGKAEIGGVGVAGSLKTVTGPLNVVSQVFAGTYNPENLWRSDTVESQYETVTDVGVTMLNVAPVRDTFYSDQDLVIQGRLNAVSFPGSTINATLDACHLLDPLDPESKCESENWTCTPNNLKVSVARNRLFTCNHSSVPFFPEQPVYTVKLTATAVGTQTVAGKQFVFADVDALLALDPNADQLDALGISRDSLNSWQKGDQSLNLGIGASGDPEVLEADTADKAIDYYIGVNVENPTSHTGVAKLYSMPDYELVLYIPSDFVQAQSGKQGVFNCIPIVDNKTLKSEFDSMSLQAPQTTNISKCTATIQSKLASGDRQTALVKIKVTKEELNNQTFSTFFVLAKLK